MSSGPTLFVPTQQLVDFTHQTTQTSVTPFLTGTNRAGTPIVTGGVVNSGTVPGSYDAIAIAPDGRTAYAYDAHAGALVPIDVATATAGSPITLPPDSRRSNYRNNVIAITPDGSTAYIAGGEDDVIPVDLATRTAGRPINLSSGPFVGVVGVAITPDGKSLVVLTNDDTDHDDRDFDQKSRPDRQGPS